MRFILAALLALPFIAAPAGAASITVALSASPSSSDPHFHDVGPNNALMHQLYGALLTTGPTLQPVPDLALSWKLLDDHSWQFKLDPQAKFSDGTPFTANDVVFTFCRTLNGVGPTHSFTTVPLALSGIDLPDAHTVILHTKLPQPLLPVQLTGYAIISAHAAGAGYVDFNPATQCGHTNLPPSSAFDELKMSVGTGRYKLVRFTAGDAIVMEPNPVHHGPKAHWSRVTMKPVPNEGARVAGLLAGDFDLIENPAQQDLATLKRRGGLAWTRLASNRIIFLQPDIGRAKSPQVEAPDGRNPLQDARVRQAISLAIDREAITRRLMGGMGTPADQYVPPPLFGFLPHPTKLPYDPAKARKLLAEAGYPHGFSLTLTGTNDRYVDDAQVVQALGQYLTRVGIKTTVDAVTATMFFPHRTKRDFSLSMGGWGYGTGEASTLLRAFVVSTMPERGLGRSNYGGYHSAAFDSVFLHAINDMDDHKRNDELQQAQRIALQDNALIPLYWETSLWAYKDRYTFTGRMDQRTDVDGLSLKN
ncbi:MAG TPA: ABC transporter substrate-binding protein [Acetobacteraceae bacterium]|nr:ABC transporter substrate-binding protein [Acetobacteraceae bacterium]